MDSVDQVKQSIDIVDLIGSYVELKKAGRNYKGFCPFHSEKTSSFMVSQELQIYKCFGCNKAGDIFSFIQDIEGIDFSAALEKLAERAGIKLEHHKGDPDRSKKAMIYEVNHITTELYHYILTKHPVGKAALAYLKEERKLSDKTIKEFRLGFAPETWSTLFESLSKKKYSITDMVTAGVVIPKRSQTGYIDRFRARVMFPLTGIDGKIVGFTGRSLDGSEPKYLNTSETLVFHKNGYIYGLEKAKISLKKEGAVFVEGQMDVISAHQAGITNVIASSGTSLTVTQLNILARYTKDLTFCFDSDFAGVSAIYRAISLAEDLDFNVRVVLIPPKYKDLDELIIASTSEAKNLLKDAIPIYDFFLVTLLKKHDKNNPIGRKKLMDELIPLFKKITNPVTLDYYVKKVSDQLDISEETVKELLSGTISKQHTSSKPLSTKDSVKFELSKTSPQEYILALLLKADLDTAQTVLYKLGQKDFTNTVFQEIFTNLKNYLLGRKRKFEIKYFADKFDGSIKDVVNELYLWDLDNVTQSPEFLLSEINSAYNRIKLATTRDEMKELTKKIKEAELAKDSKALKEYSTKFKELSEKII